MEKKINYTIYSLRKKELLEQKGLCNDPELVDCIKALEPYYGHEMKDWRPFPQISKTIKEIIDDDQEVLRLEGQRLYSYHDHFMALETKDFLNDHAERIDAFLSDNISIIFIDPLVVLMEYNKEFIVRLSAIVHNGRDTVCCFFMPHFVYHEKLFEICFDKWENVLKYYKRGVSHRIIYRVEDFYNFKNNIKSLPDSNRISKGYRNKFAKKPMPRFKK